MIKLKGCKNHTGVKAFPLLLAWPNLFNSWNLIGFPEPSHVVPEYRAGIRPKDRFIPYKYTYII